MTTFIIILQDKFYRQFKDYNSAV